MQESGIQSNRHEVLHLGCILLRVEVTLWWQQWWQDSQRKQSHLVRLSAGSTSLTRPRDYHSVRDPDQRELLEKTWTHGECKYTADDCWAARADDHKTMMRLSAADAGMIKENLTSYCKITWEFYLVKKENSLAPQWHEIPTRAICLLTSLK